MQLQLRQLVSLFGVSPGTIYRWIERDGLPALHVGERYTFNAMSLLDWAFTRQVPLMGDVYRFEASDGRPPLSLADALDRGGVEIVATGPDCRACMDQMASRLPLAPGDRELVIGLASPHGELHVRSGGPGIAIPSIVHPVVIERPDPEIRLFYFAPPIEPLSEALGPIHVWFWILSPTVRIHLQLMERLYMALREQDFKEAVIRHGLRDALLAIARRCDDTFDNLMPEAAS